MRRYDEDGRTVSIELNGFAIDQDRVSDAEYEVCVQAGECKRAPSDIGGAGGYALVTWHGAAGFCKFVGRRLPTPDEWDRAVFPPGPGQDGVPPAYLDYTCDYDDEADFRENRECVSPQDSIEIIADSSSPATVPAPLDTLSQDGVLHGDAAIYNVFIAGQQWVATTDQWAAVEKLKSPYDHVTDEPRPLRGGPVDRQVEPAWRMWDRASSPGSARFGSFRCASDTLQVEPRRIGAGRD